MSQSIPLWMVAAVLAGVVAFFAAYHFVGLIRLSTRRISESVDRLVKAFDRASAALDTARVDLGPAAAELRANMVAVPKLLETVAKVGNAQFELLQTQRAAQDELKKNPFGRPSGPMPPRDTESANLEYAITEMMRGEGVSREEAMLRLNGANNRSVWDSGNVFENWGGQQ